jgi:large subunit ribosomal protein L15
MMLNQITGMAGAHRRRLRVGRGESSGKGKTCGRGNKGLQSRAGGKLRRLVEGGQMPLFRRLPKRGFSNVQFRTQYEIVNVGTLNKHFADGDAVDVDTLRQRRMVPRGAARVRILGQGTLEKKLTVAAHAFSAKARQVIEQAGGTARLVEGKAPAEKAAAKRGKGKARPKPAAIESAGSGAMAPEAP